LKSKPQLNIGNADDDNDVIRFQKFQMEEDSLGLERIVASTGVIVVGNEKGSDKSVRDVWCGDQVINLAVTSQTPRQENVHQKRDFQINI
jgi:hypothetical protein